MSLVLNKQVTLAEVPKSAELLIQQVINGEADPIAVDNFCYCMEQFCKLVRKNKQVQKVLFIEAEKYENQTYNGATPKINTRNTPVYNDATLDELKQAVKDREKLLKSVTVNTKVIDEATGEQLEPCEYKTTSFISWEK